MPQAALNIALSGVCHTFANEARPALDAIDLTASAGEAIALIGPSGAGKSTLLTLLDGRLRGWSGAALVLGQALSPTTAPPQRARSGTGFIFQEFALVERATVRRNVLNGRLGRMGLVRSLIGNAGKVDMISVETALRDVGIADLADKRVDQLSGGQRQRVAIARCLAQNPRVILADEPVSNLDPHRARDVLALLAGVAKARDATLIFSSHQPDLAAGVATRVVALKEGRLAFDIPATDLTDQQLKQVYHTTQLAQQGLRLVG